MNKFFEEYGFACITMISGCFFLNIIFNVFISHNTLFSMVIHSLLGALMT